MRFLNESTPFPPVSEADDNGLLAVGGTLSIRRLQDAYQKGIFPWYSEDQPVLWFSPDPRMVLFPKNLNISKSMRSLLRKNIFQVTFNQNFKDVIENCAAIKRKDQEDTWITNDMIKAYCHLHELKQAYSIEVWQQQKLVGGLYGVWLRDKGVFCGESMFSKVSNASKYGFIKLVELLSSKNLKIIDCQMYTDHLASLGAQEISRLEFLNYLQ